MTPERKQYMKEYREKNREKQQEYMKAYCRTPEYKEKDSQRHAEYHAGNRDNPHYRARRLCDGSRHRATKKGMEYNLTTEFVREKLEKGVCEVTGIPFSYGGSRTERDMHGPSLDRIDPNKGYTQDNVQVVIWMYNAAKGTGTDEDVMKMAEALCRT